MDVEEKDPIVELSYPNRSVEAVIGIEGDPVTTVLSLADDIGGIIGLFNKQYQQKYCLAISNAAEFLAMLNSLAGDIVGAALDVANRIVNCVGSQIIGALSRVMGSLGRLFNAIQNFIDIVDRLLNRLDQVIRHILQSAIVSFRDFTYQTNCEYALAEMSQCAVNNFLNPSMLEEKALKISNKIYQTGDNIHDIIASEIGGNTKSLTSYINKQAFMANKAARQLTMFNS